MALISDAVAQAEEFRLAAAKDTIAIVYHADTMTTDKLVDLIASVSAAHDDSPIGHLAIVTHGGPGELHLGRGNELGSETTTGQASAWGRMRSALTNHARVDLYACSVAAGADGRSFVDELSAVTGAAVFASNNPVGTSPGADFVWEYHAGQSPTSKDLFSIQEIEAIPGLYLATVPNAQEQYMLALINRARSDPAAEAAKNGIDLNEGLPAGTISAAAKQPLAFNPRLINAAELHSQWMLDTDTFSHTGSGGTSPGNRMANAGYVFSGSWTWAENIAWQGTTGTPDVYAVVGQLENALFVDTGIAGRGHRCNLMNPSFREVGIGVRTGEFRGYNAVMITQDFAASGSNVFLTGAVYDDSLVLKNSFYTPGEGLGGVTISAVRQTDQAVFSITTWGSGGYSLALPAGTYNVTASGGPLHATYERDNVAISSLNVGVDFTVDTTTPAVPAITGILTDTGLSGTDGVTNDTTQVLSGTAEANSTVAVYNDGTSIGTATANGLGVWSFDYTSTTLADGTYQFTARATDLAGKVGTASAVFTVVVDTTAPAGSIGAVTPNPRTTPVGEVSISFSEGITGVDWSDFRLTRAGSEVSLVGSAVTRVTAAQYMLNLSTVSAAPGAYVLTLVAGGSNIRDPAGNPLAGDVLTAFVVHPWQNVGNVFDVNGDMAVTPIDVLYIINEINFKGTGPILLPAGQSFVDVNGDDALSAADVLMVINFINYSVSATGGGEGEGESVGVVGDSSPCLQVGPGEAIRADQDLTWGVQYGFSTQLLPCRVDGGPSGLLLSGQGLHTLDRTATDRRTISVAVAGRNDHLRLSTSISVSPAVSDRFFGKREPLAAGVFNALPCLPRSAAT